jgi:hypothetical protein
MMQFRAVADPDGIGAASARHDERCSDVWESIYAALVKRYLVGVSPVVMDDFEGAISAWHRAQEVVAVRQHADFFAASAIALIHPGAITALLSAQQPRLVSRAASQ